jgi:FkbM family methyltransferase
MKHFRNLLTTRSLLTYATWRAFRLQSRLEIELRKGGRILMRPLPAEDYGSAMEVFLDEVYKYPRAPLRPPLNIVDLGSNIGCSCLYWLRQFPESRVTAFEPHPIHLELLRSNLARNGLADKVTLHAAAAGTRSTKAFLTDQGLSSRIAGRGEPSCYSVTIVDFFSAIGSAPIDLLKIDIEGTEYELLSDERFSALPVRTLVMEWHPTDQHPGESGAEWCRQRLSAAGYTVEEREGFSVMWGFRQ